jgi:hypothetical protein
MTARQSTPRSRSRPRPSRRRPTPAPRPRRPRQRTFSRPARPPLPQARRPAARRRRRASLRRLPPASARPTARRPPPPTRFETDPVPTVMPDSVASRTVPRLPPALRDTRPGAAPTDPARQRRAETGGTPRPLMRRPLRPRPAEASPARSLLPRPGPRRSAARPPGTRSRCLPRARARALLARCGSRSESPPRSRSSPLSCDGAVRELPVAGRSPSRPRPAREAGTAASRASAGPRPCSSPLERPRRRASQTDQGIQRPPV